MYPKPGSWQVGFKVFMLKKFMIIPLHNDGKGLRKQGNNCTPRRVTSKKQEGTRKHNLILEIFICFGFQVHFTPHNIQSNRFWILKPMPVATCECV